MNAFTKLTILALLLFNAVTAFAQQPAQQQKLVEQGIAIEFTLDPQAPNTKLKAGEDANIEFKVTDTTTGTGVKGLSLSAWISQRAGDKAADAAQCHEKIQSYLTGSMRARPDVDLNSYYIDTGIKPSSIALQSDQKYLWVGNDGDKGEASVTVIDVGSSKVAAQISTGAGHHEIVVSNDNRFAFISNRESGTVTVVDVHELKKIKDAKVGPSPVSLALSELSKAVYAVSETDGSVAVVDAQGEVLAGIKTKPGSRQVRFAPGGRYGFVVNSKESTISVFDAASNRMLHEFKVGKTPDQVIFTDNFAFVRSLETENVAMIRLATVGTEIDITDFPGGQEIPAKGSAPVRADSIVRAPEGNGVIVANPVDRVLYYYSEGMAAPMGNFQNYRREPLAVTIVDRSLRETSPGVYSTTVKLPASGHYDVAFLTDSPRISHCFDVAADANPLLKEERPVALRLEHELKEKQLPVGQNFPVRFKLIDTKTNKAKDDLKDVRVLTFLAPGTWQRRDIAKSLGNGNYEVNLNVPESGVYMIFVESSSMGVRYRDLPHLVLHAEEKK